MNLNLRFLSTALACSILFASAALAQQRNKSGGKGGGDRGAEKAPEKAAEKKAAGPKTPADLALDEFNKVRGEPGPKDQARFQKVIGAGIAYLVQYPTHGGVNGAITNLAFYGGTIDQKQAALRTSYASFLKLDLTNQRYKDGVSDNAKTVLLALDAAVADFEVREGPNAANLANFREKIDALAEAPGGGKFLAERERSFAHMLIATGGTARAEEQLKKLLTHAEKGVKDMAREELNILEVKKEPYALKFTGLDGKEVDFAQLRGKVVALYFWSSTNKGSVDRFEGLKQIASDYRKKGFEVVTVSYDKEEDREKLLKAIKDNRISWPVYFDGKGTKNDFGAKLNTYGVPRLYVFDQKGILQTSFQGSPVGRLQPDLPQNQLERTVKKLLGIK
jgi:peroxiredoxin